MSKKEYKLNGQNINLEISPEDAFTPNAVTTLFAKTVKINPGDVVFDIGTGTGPLAIYSALNGAEQVYAIDPVDRQCELARQNVNSYNLQDKVKIFNGKFFNPIKYLEWMSGKKIKADVIIADVSGISENIARIMSYPNGDLWYPQNVPTGGRDGTEMISRVLEEAPKYLKENGKLYFPIASLSNHEKLKSCAKRFFNNLEALVDKIPFPLSQKEAELIREKGEAGTYTLDKRKSGKETWLGWIYKASLT